MAMIIKKRPTQTIVGSVGNFYSLQRVVFFSEGKLPKYSFLSSRMDNKTVSVVKNATSMSIDIETRFSTVGMNFVELVLEFRHEIVSKVNLYIMEGN